jgi:hypothetical protein
MIHALENFRVNRISIQLGEFDNLKIWNGKNMYLQNQRGIKLKMEKIPEKRL